MKFWVAFVIALIGTGLIVLAVMIPNEPLDPAGAYAMRALTLGLGVLLVWGSAVTVAGVSRRSDNEGGR